MQEEVARAFGEKWYIPRHKDIVPLDAEFVKIFLKGRFFTMADLKFMLEDCLNELDEINDLMVIHQSFFEEECPTEDDDATDCLLFAERARRHQTLITAAQEKLNKMTNILEEAVKEAFHNSKKQEEPQQAEEQEKPKGQKSPKATKVQV